MKQTIISKFEKGKAYHIIIDNKGILSHCTDVKTKLKGRASNSIQIATKGSKPNLHGIKVIAEWAKDCHNTEIKLNGDYSNDIINLVDEINRQVLK
ncbi:MAG: hypothetical protein OET18_05300 [Desulfobacterales bacterium]|nr:hypothetical protein [Desulfobacterales bacterium]